MTQTKQVRTSEWISKELNVNRKRIKFGQKEWLPANEAILITEHERLMKTTAKGVVKKYIEALEDELDKYKSKSILIEDVEKVVIDEGKKTFLNSDYRHNKLKLHILHEYRDNIKKRLKNLHNKN